MFAKPIKREYTFKELEAVAIRLLARREHSRLELFNKLINYTDQTQLIDQLLDYCTENNYLNNQRYADSYLRLRSQKGFGLQRIKQELNTKGIHPKLIQQALLNEPQDWFLLALLTYQKKYHDKLNKTVFLEYQKESAKRYRFLSYRGFSQDEIKFAMQEGELLS